MKNNIENDENNNIILMGLPNSQGEPTVAYIAKMQVHVSEAAALLGCSSQKLYMAIKSKELPAHKDGKAWKIVVKDLYKYITTISHPSE